MKRMGLIGLLAMLIVTLPSVTQAEIYTCTDEFGNVAYLQLPCPMGNSKTTEDGEDRDVSDTDVSDTDAEPRDDVAEASPAPQVASSRRPGELLEECKKRYRDQIDEIDAEIRIAFSNEQGEMYKQKLLALTQQLRACG